jgi:3-oxoacyl-(acyl-carrier-protein) synthase
VAPQFENFILAADKTREKNPKKRGPFVVPRTMFSTASATLAVPFKIKGVNYTISSACATSGHLYWECNGTNTTWKAKNRICRWK